MPTARVMSRDVEGEHLMLEFRGPESSHHEAQNDASRLPKLNPQALLALCTVSLFFNVALLFASIRPSQNSSQTQDPSYAGLKWTSVGQWEDHTEFYTRHRQAEADARWAAMLREGGGLIAIPDSEADAMGLPPAMRFPWDESKGMYFVNAYHNLHCLSSLWASFAGFRDGRAFTALDYHGFHCLEQLRQDAICYADDTPRYTGGPESNPSTGVHQRRQCRDWDKLEQWVQDRTACYRYLNHTVDDPMDRFKVCPEGTLYGAKVEAAYGLKEKERILALYGSSM